MIGVLSRSWGVTTSRYFGVADGGAIQSKNEFVFEIMADLVGNGLNLDRLHVGDDRAAAELRSIKRLDTARQAKRKQRTEANRPLLAAPRRSDQTTTLTILCGTTMIFFGARPSRARWTASNLNTAVSISLESRRGRSSGPRAFCRLPAPEALARYRRQENDPRRARAIPRWGAVLPVRPSTPHPDAASSAQKGEREFFLIP